MHIGKVAISLMILGCFVQKLLSYEESTMSWDTREGSNLFILAHREGYNNSDDFGIQCSELEAFIVQEVYCVLIC